MPEWLSAISIKCLFPEGANFIMESDCSRGLVWMAKYTSATE